MKQTDQNENFIPLLKNLKRAKPNPNLFAKIENEILEEVNVYSQNITSFQLRMASTAAILLIITNSYLLFGLNTDNNTQHENSIELISDFTIYE